LVDVYDAANTSGSSPEWPDVLLRAVPGLISHHPDAAN
jgi:hypothetical protein